MAALWAVTALAVTSGRTLLRFVSVRRVRQATAVILILLAGYAAWSASHGAPFAGTELGIARLAAQRAGRSPRRMERWMRADRRL